MSRTLKELLEEQAQFDKSHASKIPFFEEITQDNIEALEHLIVCLVGEVGELANIVKKIRRGDRDLDGSRQEMTEEIADVFIYLMKLSLQLSVDLESAYDRKMSENAVRFRKYVDDRNQGK